MSSSSSNCLKRNSELKMESNPKKSKFGFVYKFVLEELEDIAEKCKDCGLFLRRSSPRPFNFRIRTSDINEKVSRLIFRGEECECCGGCDNPDARDCEDCWGCDGDGKLCDEYECDYCSSDLIYFSMRRALPMNLVGKVSEYFNSAIGIPACAKCGAAGGERNDEECEWCFCHNMCITCKCERTDDGCACESYENNPGPWCSDPKCSPCVDAIRRVDRVFEEMANAYYNAAALT